MAVQASPYQYHHLQPPTLDAIFAGETLPIDQSAGIAGHSAYAVENIQQQPQLAMISNMPLFDTSATTPATYLGSSRKRVRDAAATEADRFGHMFMMPRNQLQGGGADAGGTRIRLALASTNGRLHTTTTAPQVFSVSPPPPPAASASTDEAAYVISQFQLQYGIDVDQLLRVHDEKLRLAVRDIRRRHYVAILSALDRRANQYLKAKQSEIRAALIRRSELEDQLRQAETQRDAWAAEASKGDAIVNELYTRLNQATLMPVGGPYSGAEEGSGDNGDEGEGLAETEEGESRCYGWAPEERDTCAAGNEANTSRMSETTVKLPGCCRLCCREKEASVVLLPCRHLCLCADCDQAEEGAGTASLACPVCGVYRNATTRIAPCL